MRRRQALANGLLAFGAWTLSSCSPKAFQSETIVDTVRILASRATKPRAQPGDVVKLDVLAYDGKNGKPADKIVYWLPIPCMNPPGDAYFACFSQFGGGGDAGTGDAGAPFGSGGDGGAGAGPLKPGMNLTSLLVPGTSFTFTMPDHIIIPRNGVATPYGLVIVFNFACGGDHLELLPIDPNNANPQQIPIGCFDKDHNQLGPDDFVFGFTRIYAYEAPTETNPVITSVDTSGGSLAVDGGTAATFTAPLCTTGNADTCEHHPIGPVVPPSKPDGKQVWTDFFSTVGKFTSDARLLYGPMVNLKIPADTDNNFLAPIDLTGAPKDNFIWIVVHDDQGGADWVTVPLEIK